MGVLGGGDSGRNWKCSKILCKILRSEKTSEIFFYIKYFCIQEYIKNIPRIYWHLLQRHALEEDPILCAHTLPM